MTTGTLERRGVCNLCEAVCGLLLTVEDGRVTKLRGNPDDPLSRGHVCPKAFALQDVHDDPDRLRRPVRRVGSGPDARWEELSWDAALDLVADRLAGTVRDHGRDAVAVYLGNPNVHSLGSMTHAGPMVRALGSRNVYSATSVDQLPHQVVAHLLYGHQLLLPVPDIDRTSLLVLVGNNPMASNGSLMTVPDFPGRVRELHERGGRLVVLDPRRTETAGVADEHLFVRPGSDAYVLLAMVRTLLEDGVARMPEYVDGLEEVRRLVEPFTCERAAEASGVPAEDVRRLARELALAESAAVHARIGASVQAHGLVCQWAVQLLNLLTGNLDRPGGTMLTRPAIDVVGRKFVGRGHWDRWRSRVRDLPEFGGELPVATLADEILTPGDGQVRAALTVAGNPVSSTPDGKRLGEALAGLDFMAAVDIYVNETTRHADVILPPTSALERDHYDLVFHVLAVRNTTRFTPAVHPKPAGSMHDWEIYREVALRTSARLGRRLPWKKQLRMRVSPTRIVDLLLRTSTPRLSLRRLRQHPDGLDLGPLEPCLPGRLQTKDKRVDLAPALVVEAVRGVDETPAAGPGEGELLLIGRRQQRDCNSWLHNTERLTRGRARHHLLMHPEDLAARGLEDGAIVQVTSRVGKVEVEAAASDTMMRGVVSLPHGYGHRGDGVRLANAAGLPGVSINDLTDPSRVDITGNAVLNGVPVTVEPRPVQG